jgi:hypothetical protein
LKAQRSLRLKIPQRYVGLGKERFELLTPIAWDRRG